MRVWWIVWHLFVLCVGIIGGLTFSLWRHGQFSQRHEVPVSDIDEGP